MPESELARFEALMLPHLDAAWRLARQLTRHPQDAEDAVQEAYLRAQRYFPGFRGGQPRAWMLTIVRHVCYARLKRPWESAALTEFDETVHGEAAPGDDPIARVERGQAGECVREALAELPVAFREAIVLRELEGLSYREISAIAGVPIGTVMSRLARARERLQRALGGTESGEATGGRGADGARAAAPDARDARREGET